MARVRLKQLYSNLSYNSASNTLIASGSLTVTGSATFLQTTGSVPAIVSSGSLYIVNSINSITGSLEGNLINGGSF
jgi:hypothetical protein